MAALFLGTVATRVVLGHSGNEALFETRLPSLQIATLLLLAGAGLRAVGGYPPTVGRENARNASLGHRAARCRALGKVALPGFRRARVQASRFTERSRSALAMTETELRLMAAPAMIGLRSRPKNG